ncbi:transcription termination factor MTERF2, chloroplastic [Mercurialis annua]|uniref:transcription termination factor MTERF2, chloroplastic n=1 Tax=Mercurialis annua TaxID=3986 RepID=UPI00216027A6|nr:transcription termination factor MTERF2, chloroplastic [Mercurialis annua]
MTIKSLSLPTNFPPIFFSSPNTSPSPPQSQLRFPNKFNSVQLPNRRRITHLLQSQTPTNSSSPSPNDTQQAISQFLQQLGLSDQDSDSIASNCPKYASMLIDSVKELEEWNNTWGTESGQQNEFGDLQGFKEKVIYMARDKGDDGKLAFLESVGLSLSSAMNVARYLSAQPLPRLVHKVKYVKDMFFSGSDDKRLIGKNARRMVMHLSVPIDEDLQQTLSLFEKIAARRGGLDMLGSSDASFPYFIESFPRIFLLSLDKHLKPMVELLENFGVPKERMGCIFLLFPPVILYDIKVIKRKVMALEKVGAVDEDIGKILLKYPWILSTSIQDNYKEILSLCDMEKITKESFDKAVRSWPHLLGCSTSKLKVILDQFGLLGVKNKKVGRVITKSPQLLLRKPEEFLQVVSFLRGIGFDQETVGKLLTRCPEVFAASMEKTLKRKVEFFISMGVMEDELPGIIKKYPELLVSDVNRTLLPRMEYLMEVGLSKKEVVKMVRRFSPLLGYSIDKVLRPKYEFLVNTMEKEVNEVVEYPRYFSYSLEKKIKPRYWVVKGRNVECSLKEMFHKNDEEFADTFLGSGRLVFPSHQ